MTLSFSVARMGLHRGSSGACNGARILGLEAGLRTAKFTVYMVHSYESVPVGMLKFVVYLQACSNLQHACHVHSNKSVPEG